MEVLACVEVQACRRAGVPAAELASGSRVAARSLAEAVRAASKAAQELEFNQSEAGKALSLCEAYKKSNPSPGNSHLTPRGIAVKSYEDVM